MNLAILNIEKEKSAVFTQNTAISEAVRLLDLRGHDTSPVFSIADKSEINRAVDFLRPDKDAVIVTGDIEAFIDAYAQNYSLDKALRVFEIDGAIYHADERKRHIRDRHIRDAVGRDIEIIHLSAEAVKRDPMILDRGFKRFKLSRW